MMLPIRARLGEPSLKYMGSKKRLLDRGLGAIVLETTQGASRFVDLFCGAGSVSWFAAANCDVPVLSVDLQRYATTLATAVTGRVAAVDTAKLGTEWLTAAQTAAAQHPHWETASLLVDKQDTPDGVAEARSLCQKPQGGLVWGAYGGYYFSPKQAILIDALVESLPADEPERNLCLAALITGAVECVASPGHTAQPFRPTANGIRFIDRCWNESPIERSRRALNSLGSQYAKQVGKGLVSDASDVVESLDAQDVVFIDPPYSAEQYSRFYHVLETIAQGKRVDVSGAGRYPSAADRPRSGFCLKSRAEAAMQELIDALATAGATGILTYPVGECSNGLSGASLLEMTEQSFKVTSWVSNGSFSTLGGNNLIRASRTPSAELVLVLKPK